MPWNETDRVEERMRFVARLREGEKLVDLCREFGISRKTGHKIKKRFEQEGLRGLEDRSRAPRRIAHRTPPEIQNLIVKAKKSKPTWGPKKLRAWLQKKHPKLNFPSANTFGYWLKKAGLVKKRGRRRRTATPSPSRLTKPAKPNQVWGVDFKGQFRLGNGRYCYPLTITDLYSRYVVAIVALDSTKAPPARQAFQEVFEEYGLPEIIRSDNGAPFASTGLLGLSSLSTYWIRLGIEAERIEPGRPDQNGRQERMHLTLKEETTRPAGHNSLQQQERFDAFREEFNEERPHEALELRPPAELYEPSQRLFQCPGTIQYPLHDFSCGVRGAGVIRFNGNAYYLSAALVGHEVGLREREPGRWVVSFMDLTLGYCDENEVRFHPEEPTL